MLDLSGDGCDAAGVLRDDPGLAAPVDDGSAQAFAEASVDLE
jgi:hypothetical protein